MLDNSYQSIVAGKIKNKKIKRVFGHNSAVGTAWEPVASAGIFRTPTTAQPLEIVSSDNTNDIAGGAGALTVLTVL